LQAEELACVLELANVPKCAVGIPYFFFAAKILINALSFLSLLVTAMAMKM